MFSKRLQNLRKSINMTQDELANRLSINRGTYANYERGHRQPDFDTLIKIADYFDVTTDFLLGRSDSKQENSQKEMSVYEKLGIPKDEYERLNPYQHEVLKWALEHDVIHMQNKKEQVLDMIETLEFAYETHKKITGN